MVQVIQNVKVGFSEKLGIAGGTIGLFSGLSLVSVVEVAYWIIRAILEMITKFIRQLAKKGDEEDKNSQEAWSGHRRDRN